MAFVPPARHLLRAKDLADARYFEPLDVEDLQRIKPAAFDLCLETFFQEPNIDMLGIRLNLPETITPASEKLYGKIADLSKANDKRVFVLTRATEPPAEVWYERLNDLGLTFTGKAPIIGDDWQ